MKMRSLLLATTIASIVTANTARADLITIGWWDNFTGGPVQQYFQDANNIDFIDVGIGSFPGQPFYFGFGQIAALTFTNPDGNKWYEFAINDVFSTAPGTMRLYADFSGIVSPTGMITVPTFFQSSEAQPGFSVAEQIYICGGTTMFCDDYVTGGGVLLPGGVAIFNNQVGTLNPTLNGFTPGSPYHLDLVFNLAATGAIGDIAGAILTSPRSEVPVPGPIVGSGLPGLLGAFAFWRYWRRRKNASTRGERSATADSTTG